MSLQETESTVRRYWDALLNRGDFASFFDDVLWTTMETGDQIRGREPVRDFIVALGSQMFDASPEFGRKTFGDGVAGLEAVFAGTHIAEFAGVPGRVPRCGSLIPCSMTSPARKSLPCVRTPDHCIG